MIQNKYSILLIVVFFCFSCKRSTDINQLHRSEKDSLTIKNNLDKSVQKKYLGEQELVDYALKAPSILSIPKLNTPFDTLQFDKVIAYDFEGNEEPYPSSIKHGHYAPVILKQQYLNKEQVTFLLTSLTNTSTYGGTTFACFTPHLSLVFYNNDKIVNVIDICLDCNYLISRNIMLSATEFHKVNSGTKDEYPLNGFSNDGKQAITTLCKELGFYYAK